LPDTRRNLPQREPIRGGRRERGDVGRFEASSQLAQRKDAAAGADERSVFACESGHPREQRRHHDGRAEHVADLFVELAADIAANVGQDAVVEQEAPGRGVDRGSCLRRSRGACRLLEPLLDLGA
jgi:hypothetical protein